MIHVLFTGFNSSSDLIGSIRLNLLVGSAHDEKNPLNVKNVKSYVGNSYILNEAENQEYSQDKAMITMAGMDDVIDYYIKDTEFIHALRYVVSNMNDDDDLLLIRPGDMVQFYNYDINPLLENKTTTGTIRFPYLYENVNDSGAKEEGARLIGGLLIPKKIISEFLSVMNICGIYRITEIKELMSAGFNLFIDYLFTSYGPQIDEHLTYKGSCTSAIDFVYHDEARSREEELLSSYFLRNPDKVNMSKIKIDEKKNETKEFDVRSINKEV